MQPTLLVLAAGMGSRYGGLKQVDQLGPNGETIIDYSIFDAIEAGFGKIVFVIKKAIEEDFKAVIGAKYETRIPVEYVFQELDKLPPGMTVHPERVKPYGTAHAILMGKDVVKEPFAVINGDDFYGKAAFKTMADFLNTLSCDATTYAMVGYELEKTLSENGFVSRGVCVTDAQNQLIEVVERTKIQKEDGKIVTPLENGIVLTLEAHTPVSMNFWGFTPALFAPLENLFKDFMTANADKPTAEFYIPSVITHLIETKKASVKVLHSDAAWFGVTYQEDRPGVVEKLHAMVQNRIYPSPLF